MPGFLRGITPLGPGAEFDLIRRLVPDRQPDPDSRGPAADSVRVGPGDDCAVVEADGLAVSSDMMVEGVHFRRAWLDPEEIGYRATAAALSDLAAMAARPLGVLTSLAFPHGDVPEFATRLGHGVHEAAGAKGARILGGDVVRTDGPLVIDVVVLGEAPHPVTRAAARPGHQAWVTGRLGAASAAVRAWGAGGEPSAPARVAFARPSPRTAEALWLNENAELGALIDLSDGLAGDSAHIAAASGVSILLEAAAIPVHDALREDADPGWPAADVRLALSGGEDYELFFTAPPDAVEPLRHEFERRFELPLTSVGVVRAGEGVHIRDDDGREAPLAELGLHAYRHFQDSETG